MTRAALLAAALLCAVPSFAARRKAAPPDAAELLRRSLAPTAASYEGLMTVEVFENGRGTTKQVAVRWQKPGLWRREVLDADGKPAQTAVSDGKREWIHDAARARVWEGEPADPDVKRLSPDDEFDLLTENYEVTAGTAALTVAGRSCWPVELRARAEGRLQRRLCVDKRTGLALSTQDFRPQGELASSARFERLTFPRRQAKALFKFTPPEGAKVVKRLDADYKALEDAKSSSGMDPKTPGWLPPGYVFESLDVLPRGGSRIIHYRYSDGVNVLSLFQCPPKLKLDFGAKTAQTLRLDGAEGTLAWTQEGRALGWEKSRARFLLVGPLSAEQMRRVADSVR